jgi:hypothetical protein
MDCTFTVKPVSLLTLFEIFLLSSSSADDEESPTIALTESREEILD